VSATKLLVLGVVRYAGEVHGYQVRQELATWNVETWANVKPGSIYHALKKAARDGLLDEVGAEPGNSGPDRVRYRITEAGAREMVALIRDALSGPKDAASLNAALAMLPALTREPAVDAITTRIEVQENARKGLRDWIANPAPDLPEHVGEQSGLWTSQLEAELVWARGLRERLRAGAYTMADDSTNQI
jgi:DNA-binding PadR family transcriptional regulator